MNASRTLLRASRPAARVVRKSPQSFRKYATESPAKSGGASGALTGALVGGGVVLGVGYGFYHFSGAKTAVQTASQAKSYVDGALNQFKLSLPDKAPKDASDAISVLKDAAKKYAAFIPGGSGYVDSAFKDIEAIRKHHGDDVDKIVHEAYSDLQSVSKKGLSVDTASEAVDVLAKHLGRLYEVAGDAADDILEGHPELKKRIGGSKEQVKKFSEQYGKEAKKQVEEVREQIKDIFKSGASWETIEKVQKLVQDAERRVKQFGDKAAQQIGDKAKEQGGEALKKGQEGASSFLGSNPTIKKLVDENKDIFKNADFSEVMEIVQKAVSSGDVKPLEEYIKKATSKK